MGYPLKKATISQQSPTSSSMKVSVPVIAALLSRASATVSFVGVAESSGEFGVYSATATPGTGLPGRFGVDYQFINEPAIDTYVDTNKVRMSCWSRL